MDWNDVRHFLALARTGSVRAAGAELGVSHSTVARRVEALEEQLATRLFDRDRNGYALTDAGEQMLPSAERIEIEMSALERGILGQDGQLAGMVALTCCDSFVSEIILGELLGFCDEHPEIELSFKNDSRAYDLSKREADVAIRTIGIGKSPPEHLVGQKAVPVVIANYVAIDHADRLDPDRTGSTPRWLAFEERSFFEAMVAETSYANVTPWGAFSSLELILQGAREGLGLLMIPTYVGDRDRALRRLEKPDLRHMADLWVLSHPDLKENARFRATRAAIVGALKKHTAIFDGSSM